MVMMMNWYAWNGQSAKKSDRDLADEISLGRGLFQRLGDACAEQRFVMLREGM